MLRKKFSIYFLALIAIIVSSCSQELDNNFENSNEVNEASRSTSLQGARFYTGRFSGGSFDDILIKGTNGIKLLRNNSANRIRTFIYKPNGTRFGSWMFNGNEDTVEGIGDFNGDGKDDILITSKWGIGVLRFKTSTNFYNLTFTSYVCRPNGTRFGYWSYNSANDKILGIADFNNDGKDDILISSSWGVGILTYSNGSFKSLVCKPYGTRFGGWYYGKNDTLGHLGDFNNNGKTDIVVQSTWGIGFLEYNGKDSLNCFMGKPFGTRFNQWSYYKGQKIKGVGNFDGKGGDDLLIESDWGVGILKLNGSSLYSIVCKPYGTYFNSWPYGKERHSVLKIGDFDGDGDDDILAEIASPTGYNGSLGMLGYSNGTLKELARANGGLGDWGIYMPFPYQFITNVSDVDGDNVDDFIIRRDSKFGVIEKSGTTIKSFIKFEY